MQKKNAEIAFFNKFGRNKDYDVFDERGYQRIVKEFLRYLRPEKEKSGCLRIVDLGCGTGSFTARFRDQGFDLSAIDISPECIRHAQKKYPSIKFEVGDIEHTRYQDETFDAVFLSGVLHHFPNLDKLLKETRRIVKPGGILIGYDPHKANPIMWLYRCKESPFYSAKGVTANEQPLTKLQINRALSACNFSEQDVYGISGGNI